MPPIKRNSFTYDPVTKKFAQIDDPKPEKQPKVELARADKERLIKEFKAIFKRPPNEDEKETLFVEERKIKRGRR